MYLREAVFFNFDGHSMHMRRQDHGATASIISVPSLTADRKHSCFRFRTSTTNSIYHDIFLRFIDWMCLSSIYTQVTVPITFIARQDTSRTGIDDRLSWIPGRAKSMHSFSARTTYIRWSYRFRYGLYIGEKRRLTKTLMVLAHIESRKPSSI